MSNHIDPTQTWVAKVIDWSANNPFFVLLASVLLLVVGIMSLQKTPLDAIPDLSDTQVIVRTDYAGQSPQVVEDQVTYPLSTQMLGLPKTKVVRAYSLFGTSFVYIIFEDGVDMYWARSRVLESLSQITDKLPEGATTQLGPDATGVGWVFQYALKDTTGKYDLAQLRSLQDWFIKFELAPVAGVSEIASVGGYEKEYQVSVDPIKLQAFDVPLNRVLEAVRQSNMETGGRTLEMAEAEYMIRSFGYVDDIDDLKNTVVYSVDGTPVTLDRLATVHTGPALRRGLVELNGEGETVGGIVIMRPNANALTVINDIKLKLESIKEGLPKGVELVTVYDRSNLIEGAVSYLNTKLFEESLMVAFVCFIFLLHIRSALVAIVTLPLGILGAFIVMHMQGISANIMSLGGIAIAIGAMVDASIVMVENAHRKLANLKPEATRQEKNAAILLSAKEVGPGLFFSLLIITVSFIPVFALTGQSYKLFTPLAYTKTYAMAFASILSITIVPVLMLWLIRGKIRKESDNPVNTFFIKMYKPLLEKALRYPKHIIVIAGVLLASTIWPAMRTGSEFMPPLYEGSFLYMPSTLPGVGITKARELVQITNQAIKKIPEVETVFGKAGRADTATDPAPLSMIETWVMLKPRDQWRKGLTPEDLQAELDSVTKVPGMVNSWGYPIKIRLDMLSTGIRTPVGIKISGTDLNTINKIGQEVERVSKTVEGTRSAIADRVQGGKYIEIIPNRKQLTRYGISLHTMQKVIQTALGGMKLTEAVEGRERYNVMVRYERRYRENYDDIKSVLIPTPEGAHIPLSYVADVQINEGPPMIKSENARLNGWVLVDIKDRDIGSYIKDLQQTLSQEVKLPAGYNIAFSGQFEQMQKANARLKIAIPATLLIIITLLYIHFGRWDRTAIILSALPFGVLGGVWMVYLAGYNLSVAVAVGFIALAGVAVETAIVMLIYIDNQVNKEKPLTTADLHKSIMHGAVQRVRPKLMTVSVIMFGLLPIFFTEGPGGDVMRRIALPMLGGMASTTILTLILIPVGYYVYFKKGLK